MKSNAGQDQPAWARPNAFPAKPREGNYGVLDGKGGKRSFETLEDLKKDLQSGKGRLSFVWAPQSDRLMAPEEIPDLADVLRNRRLVFARDDEGEARQTLLFTGPVLLYAFYAFLTNKAPLGFARLDFLVLVAFAFLYFTARPWWEARKGRETARSLTRESLSEEIPEARFDLWMDYQRAPLTLLLLCLLVIVGAVQSASPGLGIEEAGFDKMRYGMGERWRLFTGAFMHGNLIHFLLNASALWYLGRRLEILAKWPHLSGVFFLSMIGSGWATLSWKPMQISVGISGVVCGFLGFLLVFETLHARLVPRQARRRLLAILVSLVVIGIMGFRFIDNAAHFGGLATGAAYAFLVFPRSSSPHRPRILGQDLAIGGVSMALIICSALGAVAAMLF